MHDDNNLQKEIESWHRSLNATIQQSLDSTGDTSRQEPPGTVRV